VRYHFVRQLQEDVIIDAIYVFSKEQKADLFTKPLPKPEFERMRKELGVDGIVLRNRKTYGMGDYLFHVTIALQQALKQIS
jgi:hypothetical protein